MSSMRDKIYDATFQALPLAFSRDLINIIVNKEEDKTSYLYSGKGYYEYFTEPCGIDNRDPEEINAEWDSDLSREAHRERVFRCIEGGFLTTLWVAIKSKKFFWGRDLDIGGEPTNYLMTAISYGESRRGVALLILDQVEQDEARMLVQNPVRISYLRVAPKTIGLYISSEYKEVFEFSTCVMMRYAWQLTKVRPKLWSHYYITKPNSIPLLNYRVLDFLLNILLLLF